jgi:sulfur relay (sulfurtransferase) DsrC/TusE family protein
MICYNKTFKLLRSTFSIIISARHFFINFQIGTNSTVAVLIKLCLVKSGVYKIVDNTSMNQYFNAHTLYEYFEFQGVVFF